MIKNIHVKKFLIGIVIGIAAITPGISGSVIAASFGIYEEIVDRISSFNENLKDNCIYLLPYITGGGVGVFIFANLLKNIMIYSRFEIMYIFTGLILGTIPCYIRDANKFGFKFFYPVIALGSTILFIFIFKIPMNFSIGLNNNLLRLIISGVILSFGTVIPGLSSSLLLMKFGLYNEYISVISDIKVKKMLYIAAGFAIVSLFLSKLVSILYKKTYGVFSYFILGLLISSVITMFPGVRNARFAVVDMSLMYISFVMSFLLMSYKTKI